MFIPLQTPTSVQREIAGKRGEPPEQFAFRFVKQVIAPVERRGECLVPRQGGAPAARQDAKTVPEVSGQIAQPETADSGSRQFQRQRDTVEPAANLDNRRRVRVAERESVRRRARTIFEQLDGRIMHRLCGGEIDPSQRSFQGGEPVQPFTFGP